MKCVILTSKIFEIWFVINFLIHSFIVCNFKVKSFSFLFVVFQIKILWFGDKFIALIVGWILEILKCYFCMSRKVSIMLQKLPETSMLHLETYHSMLVWKDWNWEWESDKRRLGQNRDCCGEWSFMNNSWKKFRQYC